MIHDYYKRFGEPVKNSKQINKLRNNEFVESLTWVIIAIIITITALSL